MACWQLSTQQLLPRAYHSDIPRHSRSARRAHPHPCPSPVCVQVCTGWRDAHDAALPALEPNAVPPDAAAAPGSRNLGGVRTLRLGAGAITTTSAAGVRIPPTFDLYAWVQPAAVGRLMFLTMLTRLELSFVDKPITDAWVSSLPCLPHFPWSPSGQRRSPKVLVIVSRHRRVNALLYAVGIY
jgi:hypothetical protein